MDLYGFLVTTYNTFLALFPPQLQWVVTLAIILVMIGTLIGLIRQHIAFALLLIPLGPILWPVIVHFMTDLGNFFLYLVHSSGAPAK
jgi:hypothetical protein